VKWLLRGLVLALLVYAYLALPAIGDVNHRTLHTSVARAVGGELTVGPRGCRRTGEAYRCTVIAFPGDSNGTTYTVRKRGRRCWTASARSPVPEVPALARGCAKLREQGRVGRWVSQVVP
jgi:hypothetical protein